MSESDELRATQSQRDDFKRQLSAEREGRMAAERIVDEVRARNRELEGAFNAFIKLTQVVGQHQDAMFEGAPLNAAFIKASTEIARHAPPASELKNVTEFVHDRDG